VRVRIIALGHRMPAWVTAGFDDYARRLPREFPLDIVELKPEPRDRGRSVEQLLAAEAKRIAAVSKGCHVVALDERGERWTTVRLAQTLRDWRERGVDVAFVIGSADGLSTDFKRNANVIMSLSALTLPHGLVRVLLAEQLYRATSLLRGHPYHRQ
jgi:23S rRNA (pseudouridine1915-N3)-methyltransferase